MKYLKELWKILLDKISQEIKKYKNPDKPRNQWKHFTIVLSITHFLGWMFWQLEKNPKNQIGLWWATLIWSLFLLFIFEVNQMRKATQPDNGGKKKISPAQYWQRKWKDSLYDILVGMLGALLGLLPFWLM